MKGRVELDVSVECSPVDGYKCTGKECSFKDYPDMNGFDICELAYPDGKCHCKNARAAADQLYQQQQKEGEV